MLRKLSLALGSIAAMLLLSGVISILEYRRMSNYVSELIAYDINSINLSRELADMTQEYNLKMLAVVLQNDIALIPQPDMKAFGAQMDSLRVSVTSPNVLPMLDIVESSFNEYIGTSLKFDEIFLADTVNTGEWFFGSLQPSYNKFRRYVAVLNDSINHELLNNSSDFDAGFYRSIIPGVVSVGAGILLVMLLGYFIAAYYVRPIMKMSDGIYNYRQMGKRFYRIIAEKTLDYVLQELTDAEGGFYCGQDADSEGVEGKYYVFTPAEIRDILQEKAAEFWAGRDDVEAVLVTNDGTVYVTEGLKDSFSDCEFKVIVR